MILTLYRIVLVNPPTVDDFTSNVAKGRPIPPLLPSNLHWLWDGLSVYDSAAAAESLAIRSPALGMFVVEMRLPDNRFRLLRTTRAKGHYTVWGEPEELPQCVIHTRPILRVLRRS